MQTLEEVLADLDSRGDEVIMIPLIKKGTLKSHGRRGDTYPDYLYPERLEYEVEKMLPFVTSELAQGIREFEEETKKFLEETRIWDSMKEMTVISHGTDQDNDQVSDQDNSPAERLLSTLGNSALSA